jgi:hypothetical protein
MIKLLDNDTDAEIGAIDDAHLEILQEELVEESLDDFTYSIDAAAIASLEGRGVDAGVVAVLKRALGEKPSVDIRFEPD